MIVINKIETNGWEAAIRGMRNPMNSWEKSDSGPCLTHGPWHCEDCPYPEEDCSGSEADLVNHYIIGPNDLKLMLNLAKSGSDHAKFRRMINVTMDILAPLYWWKEFDTYKVGTVANSCSTMHKIAEREFKLYDFSNEHLISDEPIPTRTYSPFGALAATVENLNIMRLLFLETNDKKYWWQMIQLLPSSYNQLRTVQLNYEVLANIYHSRKEHKLDEWRELCKIIEKLPYSEIITLKEGENNAD